MIEITLRIESRPRGYCIDARVTQGSTATEGESAVADMLRQIIHPAFTTELSQQGVQVTVSGDLHP